MSSQNNADSPFAELVPFLDRIACAIERLANESRQSGDIADSPSVSRQSEAMVWAVTHGVTDNSTIAKQFGVDPRTVRRWDKLQQLLDGLRFEVSRGQLQSGYRTTDGVDSFRAENQ